MNRIESIDQPLVNAVGMGAGAPVVCIHGLAASLHDWKDLMPALAASGYEAHALDLLGHGESLKPDRMEDYSAEACYAHMAAWIESLRLERPVIMVGHSLGGYLALEHALRCPESVRALVLVDPFYTLDQLPGFLRARYRRPFITAEMIELAPLWLVRLAIDLTGLSIRNGFVEPEAARAQSARDYKRAAPGVFNLPHTIRDQTGDLPKVSVPALVLWGSKDGTLAPWSFPTMVQALPNARAATIAAGHVPHRTNADEFNRLVLEFLKDI